MKLSPTQLALLRRRPHQTQLYLSIYHPKTLMAAQVASGTYNVGENTIPYMLVSTGSYLNLYEDLTVLVGTNPGDDDYGRIRMRSATGTYILFAENAINWNQGQYLTFLDQIDVQAIYPRIIQDPNNETNVIFYKDYDIPYSNQNQIYGTFINAGPHRAGFISSGTFFFSATGTFNVNSDALTYSWVFQGGNPTGSTAETPGLVKWNTVGDYKVILQVTSSEGAVDTTYRYVSMYDRPGEGSHPPISRWELQNLSGSRSEGGYTASFKVYENLGDVQPNAVVVMFGETSYGGTNLNLGGNAINNSGIYFVGYILGDSIKFSWDYSYVEFSVGSVTAMMKNAEGFSVSCESKASPTTWFQLYEMTVERAIYHYLRWHSTVLKVTDFQYLGENRLVQYFDADRGSLYDAIDSFVRDGVLGETIADRQGKIWAEISSYGLQTPFSDIPDNMTFFRNDWMEDPTIEERRNFELSFIELGGIAYYGVASNTFSALLSNAPSTVPLYHGKADRKEGMILDSQTQINQISGNYLAHNNTKFPNISMSLAGAYLNLDIVPQEKNYLLLSAGDTVRNKSVQDLPYIVSSMDWKYSSVDQSFYPDIALLQIATGTAGVTVEIPVTPPDNGYSYPSLQLPPLPTFNNSSPVGPTVNTVMVFIDSTANPNGAKGVIYSTDFDSGSPHWLTMNDGLPHLNIMFIFMCPNGVLYCGHNSYTTSSAPDAFLARSPGVGQPWTVIENWASLHGKHPANSAAGLGIAGFNPDVPEQIIYMTNGDTGSDFDVYYGSAGSYSKTLSLSAAGNLNCNLMATFGNNQWRITGSSSPTTKPCWLLTPNAGSVATSLSLPADTYPVLQYPGGSTAKVFTGRNGFLGLYKYANNFKDAPTYITDSLAQGNGLGIDTSGMYLMGKWDVGAKGRSSDGGATWLPLPTLPPGIYQFAYAGTGGSATSTRWVAIGNGSVIRFSPDFGDTWINKEGDIGNLSPTLRPAAIAVQGIPRGAVFQ